ncbi:hypothetical protein CSUNSWCD_498 [Campylobacter showae CSUNSWCD]|uniref:Uncharacterized protein n=1 Tax=Campylobacter showae CSUNSWCD TaxID=1244083 RepID=M5IE85_9BACT|nr:hypothetical protein CSUNSWCD_498 [Campylobacter showae CSUNSWCD]
MERLAFFALCGRALFAWFLFHLWLQSQAIAMFAAKFGQVAPKSSRNRCGFCEAKCFCKKLRLLKLKFEVKFEL